MRVASDISFPPSISHSVGGLRPDGPQRAFHGDLFLRARLHLLRKTRVPETVSYHQLLVCLRFATNLKCPQVPSGRSLGSAGSSSIQTGQEAPPHSQTHCHLRPEPSAGTWPFPSCRCGQGSAKLAAETGAGPLGTGTGLGGAGGGEEGALVTPGRDSRLALTPRVGYQVTVAAVQGRQGQNAVHLCATRFIFVNTSEVLKEKAPLKHGCTGENAPPGDTGSFTSLGVIRRRWPTQGPPRESS